MISIFVQNINYGIITFIGTMLTFAATCFLLHKAKDFLPQDQGREFAHDGKLSAGKPRGAGFIFILVFAAAYILFGRINTERLIYVVLVVASMLTGYLDDCAKNPWGEYKKGLLDLLLAVMTAVTYINFNGTRLIIASLGVDINLHPLLFGLLIVVLVWASINVTNCADGVDGLSGTLTIITLTTIYIMIDMQGGDADFSYSILLFIVCILGYLWYNATPSRMLMGDAGSRAMGIFIAIAILKTDNPIMYIPTAFVLIMDGGLGLLKVALLRFLKIHIFKNTRLPLHDHVRKKWGWSNTQTVFRFSIIQIIISIALLYSAIALAL